MFGWTRFVPAAVLLLLSAAPSGGGEEGSLRVFYLPESIYEDEPLCIHVSAVEGDVKAWRWEGKKKSPLAVRRRHGEEEIRLPASLVGRTDWVVLECGSVSLRVRILRTWEVLPNLHVSGERLCDAKSDAVVLVTRKRSASPDRRWALFRWIARRLFPRRKPRRLVLLDCSRKGESLLEVLCSLDARLRRDADAVLLVPSDASCRRGVDPIVFRRRCEAVVEQLLLRGVRRVRFAFPLLGEAYAACRSAMDAEVKRVSTEFRLEAPLRLKGVPDVKEILRLW